MAKKTDQKGKGGKFSRKPQGGKPSGRDTKKTLAPKRSFRQPEEETPRRIRNPFENLARQRADDDWDDFRTEDGEQRPVSRQRKTSPTTKRAVKPSPVGKKPVSGGGKTAAPGRKTSPGKRAADTHGEKPVTVRKPSAPKKSPRPKKEKTPKDPAVYGERLQKILATAGLGSRRDCEELILAGRIMVDREVVDELGARVMPHQSIHFDGELLRRATKRHYFALNKPTNVICTNDDPAGRRRALDYIHENAVGLFPVGRLDLHSEGLLLITNDGELANRLTHPRYEVPKIYQVRVSGVPSREELEKISRGVHLADGIARAEEVKVLHRYQDGTSMLLITLREGRNREIRRILAHVGHNVLSLQRVAIGPLKLGKTPVGGYRTLTRDEVNQLRKLVGLAEK